MLYMVTMGYYIVMDHQWVINGLSMDFQWIISGLSVGLWT